jgi:hyperosmotically inducible periplasmic protein
VLQLESGRGSSDELAGSSGGKGGRLLLAGLVAGWSLSFLLDPRSGRRRRERTMAVARHQVRHLRRERRAIARRAAGKTRGALHRLALWQPVPELDEAGLAHKVESVLFRDQRLPKGAISINAEGGVVFLRGQVVDAEIIDEMAKRVAAIAGVEEVRNLLHLPGTPPPGVSPGAVGVEAS